MDQPLRDIYLQSVSDAQAILRLKSINADLLAALVAALKQMELQQDMEFDTKPGSSSECSIVTNARAAIAAAAQPTND